MILKLILAVVVFVVVSCSSDYKEFSTLDPKAQRIYIIVRSGLSIAQRHELISQVLKCPCDTTKQKE